MKQKTNKRIAKTFWKTGTGKIMRRKTGQNHFNSRESGKVTKSKRLDHALTPSDFKRINKAI